MQAVKLAAHEHPVACRTVPVQSEVLSKTVGNPTTLSTEKHKPVKLFVLLLISVIDKSLTVVPYVRRYSRGSLWRSGLDMTKRKQIHLGDHGKLGANENAIK